MLDLAKEYLMVNSKVHNKYSKTKILINKFNK
jgi:hypothetical protein